jgi:hypothetical protein
MHRIDSATARANANGTGKTGFSDNGDLPNQDATYFTPEWANSLQEEVAGAIEGLGFALDKADNGQLLAALVQQFAEKQVLTEAIIEYRDKIDEDRVRLKNLEDRTYADIQVDELMFTYRHFVTAAQVAAYKGYGTWERALQGRMAVGFSEDPNAHIDFRTKGAEYGEREHTLTIDEMPKHRHSLKHGRDNGSTDNNAGTIASDTGNWSSQYIPDSTIGTAGGDQPHNNMPPAKTINCWRRIA